MKKLNKDRIFRHMARDVPPRYFYVFNVYGGPPSSEIVSLFEKTAKKEAKLWVKLAGIRWPDKKVVMANDVYYDIDYDKYKVWFDFTVE